MSYHDDVVVSSKELSMLRADANRLNKLERMINKWEIRFNFHPLSGALFITRSTSGLKNSSAHATIRHAIDNCPDP